MLVAIHQPNFFPWLGYFDKLARCDRFVILDTVSLQRTRSHYTNRVQILLSGRRRWITMPVVRGLESQQRIAESEIAEDDRWRRRLIGTITHSYAKAPFFAEIMPLVKGLLACQTTSLRDFNVKTMTELARSIGIDSNKLFLASDLGIEGRATDHLVALVLAIGGSGYYAGGGASGYQVDAEFTAAGLQVCYQNFRHPRYHQVGASEFVPGLSIIDALMNCGPLGVRDMLMTPCVS